MCCGVARGVMSLTLCIAVVMISEEMHALEGLVSPLFEGAKGIGNGSKVVARVISVECTRS